MSRFSTGAGIDGSQVPKTQGIYGKTIMMIGGLVACPVLVLPFYPEELGYAPAFLIPSMITIAAGGFLYVNRPPQKDRLMEWRSLLQKGSGPVLFIWCCAFVCGAAPFLIGGQLGPVTALFESISGWTTTGLTVSDVRHMPHVFLFHRSFMQYCGGLGFVVMLAMAFQGSQAVSLFNAEGHPDKLAPNLRGTALSLAYLYLGWLVVGATLYRICGMPLFSAVCHTMSALSTAGFSTEEASIGAYHSAPIEMVSVLLMLVGATNFAVVQSFVRGRFKQMLRDSELRFMVLLTGGSTLLVAIALCREDGSTVLRGIRQGLFGVVTTFTTTGYSTMDYAAWPALGLGILAMLMVVGGCTGSTAGGIKMIRAYLLVRITVLNMERRMNPNSWVCAPSYIHHKNSVAIDERCKEDVLGFVMIYVATLFVGILLMSLFSGCSLPAAAFEFTSALGTVGISNGLTSADAPTAQLALEMFAMVLGRLEILMVFVGLHSLVKCLYKR